MLRAAEQIRALTVVMGKVVMVDRERCRMHIDHRKGVLYIDENESTEDICKDVIEACARVVERRAKFASPTL